MEVLDKVASSLQLSADEYRKTADLMVAAEAIASRAGVPLDEQARLGLAAHLASLCRRLARGERVEAVDAALFEEVPILYRRMARELVQPLYDELGLDVDPTEVGLIALHYAAARERAAEKNAGGG